MNTLLEIGKFSRQKARLFRGLKTLTIEIEINLFVVIARGIIIRRMNAGSRGRDLHP